MVNLPVLQPKDLFSNELVSRWAEALELRLDSEKTSRTNYKVEVVSEDNESTFSVSLISETHGAKRFISLGEISLTPGIINQFQSCHL